jgi:hypothetical protein
VNVDPNWLTNTIQDVAKVDIKDGDIFPTTISKLSGRELGGLQDILDTYGPAFEKGAITPEEFITLRQKLDRIAYTDAGIKNSNIAAVASKLRGQLNEAYRPQINGLEKLDNEYASQLKDIQKLRKGLFDKNGSLLPNAEQKIANAANATKPTREGSQIANLEHLVPGITEKIKALKAIEDIRNAGDIKVGTYTASGLKAGELLTGAYGVATGNLAVAAAAIATYLISQPTRAVEIIKAVNAIDPKLATLVMARLARVATVGAVASKAQQQSPQSQETTASQPPVAPPDTQAPEVAPQQQ